MIPQHYLVKITDKYNNYYKIILQLNQEKIEVLSLRTRKIITLSGFIIGLMIRIVHFHQGNNRGKTLRYKAFIIIIFPQKQLPCFHSSSLVLTESQKSRFPCQDIGQDKRKNIYNLQFPVEWNLELQIKICTYYRYMISSSSPSVVFDSNHLTIMLLISLLSHDIYIQVCNKFYSLYRLLNNVNYQHQPITYNYLCPIKPLGKKNQVWRCESTDCSLK